MTSPHILRIVLGLYVQYCPCKASEQKLGEKTKSELKEIELSYANLMFLPKSGIWPIYNIVCQLMVILAKCFEI